MSTNCIECRHTCFDKNFINANYPINVYREETYANEIMGGGKEGGGGALH